MAHNIPMLERSPILVLMKQVGVLRVEDTATALLDILEPTRVDLNLRHQIHLAELAAHIIGGNGVAEGERRGGALLAEDHHVGEVSGEVRVGGLAEDAAGWEDVLDGADG